MSVMTLKRTTSVALAALAAASGNTAVPLVSVVATANSGPTRKASSKKASLLQKKRSQQEKRRLLISDSNNFMDAELKKILQQLKDWNVPKDAKAIKGAIKGIKGAYVYEDIILQAYPMYDQMMKVAESSEPLSNLSEEGDEPSKKSSNEPEQPPQSSAGLLDKSLLTLGMDAQKILADEIAEPILESLKTTFVKDLPEEVQTHITEFVSDWKAGKPEDMTQASVLQLKGEWTFKVYVPEDEKIETVVENYAGGLVEQAIRNSLPVYKPYSVSVESVKESTTERRALQYGNSAADLQAMLGGLGDVNALLAQAEGNLSGSEYSDDQLAAASAMAANMLNIEGMTGLNNNNNAGSLVDIEAAAENIEAAAEASAAQANIEPEKNTEGSSAVEKQKALLEGKKEVKLQASYTVNVPLTLRDGPKPFGEVADESEKRLMDGQELVKKVLISLVAWGAEGEDDKTYSRDKLVEELQTSTKISSATDDYHVADDVEDVFVSHKLLPGSYYKKISVAAPIPYAPAGSSNLNEQGSYEPASLSDADMYSKYGSSITGSGEEEEDMYSKYGSSVTASGSSFEVSSANGLFSGVISTVVISAATVLFF